jgi:hypothetical protein
MKSLISILFLIIFISCGIKKETNVTVNKGITDLEKQIVNDFLDTELKKERYNNYKDYQIVVIEEALGKMKPLSTYEFNYIYKNSWGKFISEWQLDSLQIKRIKAGLKNEKIYFWKASDFNNFKVNILKYEELRNIINTGQYINLPKRKIIYLSTPLIIDNNNALLSFEIGNGDLGFNPITHFTVLMQKVNGIWIQKSFYEDGVYY